MSSTPETSQQLRSWLNEAAFSNVGGVPVSNVLVEGRSTVEQAVHDLDLTGVPCPDVLVKRCGAIKEERHVFYASGVPGSNVLVEVVVVLKEVAEVLYVGDVPFSDGAATGRAGVDLARAGARFCEARVDHRSEGVSVGRAAGIKAWVAVDRAAADRRIAVVIAARRRVGEATEAGEGFIACQAAVAGGRRDAVGDPRWVDLDSLEVGAHIALYDRVHPIMVGYGDGVGALSRRVGGHFAEVGRAAHVQIDTAPLQQTRACPGLLEGSHHKEDPRAGCRSRNGEGRRGAHVECRRTLKCQGVAWETRDGVSLRLRLRAGWLTVGDPRGDIAPRTVR